MAVVLNQASAAYSAGGTTGPLYTGPAQSLAVDVNVSAVSGTTPSLSLFLERQGADGVWYAIWSPAAITAVGAVSTSIGPGCVIAEVPTGTGRLRWTISGTTPVVTFSASVISR